MVVSSSSQGLKFVGFLIIGNDCNQLGNTNPPWEYCCGRCCCAWACFGEGGIFKLGSLSKLVFDDPPSARWSASRSAGDGANALRSDELLEDAEGGRTIALLSPFGLRASYSYDDAEGTGPGPVADGWDFRPKLNTLASGFNPFFFVMPAVENHRFEPASSVED